jgi:hypothetical protein
MHAAKVTKQFQGAEDGKHYPRTIKVGETIAGDLAKVAVEQGWALPLETAGQKAQASAPANKALPAATRNK